MTITEISQGIRRQLHREYTICYVSTPDSYSAPRLMDHIEGCHCCWKHNYLSVVSICSLGFGVGYRALTNVDGALYGAAIAIAAACIQDSVSIRRSRVD